MSDINNELTAKKSESGVLQSLEGHSIDALKVFLQYLSKNEKVIKYFCDKWEIQYRAFIKNMFLIIYLHDTGKCIQEFQTNIKSNKHSPDYPHSYHFLHILIRLIKDGILLFDNSYDKNNLFEVGCIMAHHSQLHREFYKTVDKTSKQYNDKSINSFINNAVNVYKELGFDSYGGTLMFEKINTAYFSTDHSTIHGLVKCFEKISDITDDFASKARNKAVFTYMLSILKTSDILSSRYFDMNAVKYMEYEVVGSILNENVLSSIGELTTEKILQNNKPYPYQKDAMSINGNAILVAGCGRGKTETSLIICNNLIKENKVNRVIYAMPTQVTSNAMADRLAGLYGKDYVGIYHGKSLINKMMLCEDEDEEYKEIKDENFQSKNFMKPVCVTTVDHVLYSLIHAYKTSDFACGGLQTSVIVFDEIHYYEKTTMEYIYEALRILREMRIPHILMSATLPEFIIKDIKDKYYYIYDNEGMSYKPFIIKRINERLITKLDGEWNINQWFIKELIKNYKYGMRQTIIVNTVDKAQQVYESIICLKEISQGDVLLFHGRFTVNDRRKKEEEIFSKNSKYPFILITTQIIEISVDVSCNIMFTELAPFDALAQRGGRLNRKGTNYIVNGVNQTMYVFDIENTRPYAKDIEDGAFRYLYNSWASIPDSPISYEEIKNIVDDIYKDEKFLQTEYTGLFLKSSLFGNTPEDVRGARVDEDTGGHFCTRKSDFKQIDVIPSIRIPECVNNVTLASNIIKIPQYLLFQFPEMFYNQEINGQMYRVCKFKYTYEKGIESGIEDNSGYFE